MIYTGIGARKTPGNILHAMVGVAKYMARKGHILRSGGAKGADSAFEIGCDYKSNGRKHSLKEIYLPWQGFEKHNSPFDLVSPEAMDVAALFHPAWDRLTDESKKMMGRNAYQMLGLFLNHPTDMVICWTPGGKVVGGTGQAIRMASAYDIPTFNLGSASLNIMNEKILDFMETVS